MASATLSVEDAADGGWTFDWVSGRSAYFGDEDPTRSVPAALTAPWGNVVYRLGPDRSWQGVQNLDELREAIAALFGAEGQAADDIADLFQQIPDDAFAASVSQTQRILHVVENWGPVTADRQSGPDTLYNFFGADPFPAISDIQMVQAIDEYGCVGIWMETELDVEQATDAVAATLRLLLPGEPVTTAQAEEAAEELEVARRLYARYDYHTGFLVEVIAVQNISVSGFQLEVTTIISDVTDRAAVL